MISDKKIFTCCAVGCVHAMKWNALSLTIDLLSIEKATSWEPSVSLDVTQFPFPTKIITAIEGMGKSLAGKTLLELFLCSAYDSIVCHHLDLFHLILLLKCFLTSKCAWDRNYSHGSIWSPGISFMGFTRIFSLLGPWILFEASIRNFKRVHCA